MCPVRCSQSLGNVIDFPVRDSDDLLFRMDVLPVHGLVSYHFWPKRGESGESDIRADVIQHEPDLIRFADDPRDTVSVFNPALLREPCHQVEETDNPKL